MFHPRHTRESIPKFWCKTSTFVSTLYLVACSEKAPSESCPPLDSEVKQAIVNGTAVELYLGLGSEDIRAIVAIRDGDGPRAALCAGALVRPDRVLTSAHCLVMQSPRVQIELADTVQRFASVVNADAHPELDVALMTISPPLSAEEQQAIHPLAAGFNLAQTNWVGERVELAGYGVSELGQPDGLRFAVESVFELNDTKIRVNGWHRSGACEGDSGGPLLIRDAAGRPTVAGVLSTGSASCVERDSYIRADKFAAWLESLLGATTRDPPECGAISEGGRCLFGSALNCVGGELVSQACDGGCGWDTAQRAFGCVALEKDPCAGAGSQGICRGSRGLTCDAGKLNNVDCAPCSECLYSPQTGLPECVRSSSE